MIRHNHKSASMDIVFMCDKLKPIVQQIIRLCNFKQWQPVVTGKSDEPHWVAYFMLGADGHRINIADLLDVEAWRRTQGPLRETLLGREKLLHVAS